MWHPFVSKTLTCPYHTVYIDIQHNFFHIEMFSKCSFNFFLAVVYKENRTANCPTVLEGSMGRNTADITVGVAKIASQYFVASKRFTAKRLFFGIFSSRNQKAVHMQS